MTQDKDKLVTVPGELHSAATGNVVASADAVYDYTLDSSQSALNYDSPCYNVSNHHTHEVVIDGSTVVTNHYSFEEAVQLVPEALRVGGLKLTFISYNNEVESYVYNGIDVEEFYNENKWETNLGKYIECPEYLQVTLDSSNKIIDCIKPDGTKVFNVGLESENIQSENIETEKINIGGNEYYVFENPEYIQVTLDSSNKVVDYIKPDGTKVFNAGLESKNIKSEIINSEIIESETINSKTSNVETIYPQKINIGCNEYYVTENQEWIRVITDNEGKIIAGIRTNGSTYIAEFEGIDIDSIKKEIQEYIKSITANIKDITDTFKYIEDPEERSEITLDSEERIISYRKNDGTLVENVSIESDNIKTNSLTLTPNGMTEFQQALRDSGFSGGTGDWSDAKTLQIPEPRLAMVNITNATNDATLPVNKFEKPLVMQFWDMAGNYFQKNILIATQGDTSTWMAKKNFGFDICNDEWEGDDTFGLKIGNWVEQDSFHIKAGANDAFHGMLAVMYKWVELATKKLDTRPDRFAHGSGNSTIAAATKGSLDKDFGTGALCHPDGFPCIVYLNGEFYGVYSWQLKKHRANYFMDKKDYESIHLDGFVGPTFFGGTIEWNAPGIEIKNPKTLYCMDGTKYDSDNGKELIDSTSPFYDPNNKDHKNTVKAKNTIIAMSQALSLVYAEVGVDAQKAKFEELFDKDAIETLYLMNSAMCNGDSVIKNTQWLYYKDCKIVPAFYDLDGAFGHSITGQFITGSIFTPTSFNVANYPLKFVYDNYKSELDAKWKILRDSGIVSVDTVKELLYDWIDRIGYEFYKKENKKWPCPSFRESHLNSAYWEPASGSNWTVYNDTTQYNVGDLVSVDNWEYATKYRCKQACVGEPPCTELYEGHPISGGCFETPQRLLNNVAAQIEHLDSYYNYNI